MAGAIWANDQARRMEFSSTIAAMVDLSEIPDLLRRSGRRQADLARHLELDPSSLTKTIKGQRQLKANEAVKIEQFFNDPDLTISSLRPASDQPSRARSTGRRIPVYGYAAGVGDDRLAFTDGSIVDRIEAPPLWGGAGELVGVRTPGSKMEPRLFAGEIVLAQLHLPPARGQDCLVEFTDGTAEIRTFVQRRDGHVFLKQWNPDEEIRYEATLVKALHAVIWRR